MKTKVLLSLILFVPACAPVANVRAQPAAWSRYTYPGEEFSVEMPSMPWAFHTVRAISLTSDESEKVNVFGRYAGGVVYMVVSFDRPHSVEPDDRLAAYFWNGRGLTRTGEVKLGGLTGREYDISLDFGGGFRGKARFFRTKGRAYLVEAFSNADGHGEEFGRFLNSFALGAKPSGESIRDDAPYTPPKETPTPGAGAAPAGEGPYKSTELVRKAVIVFKPEPGYTEEARRNDITGVVRLRAVLTPAGEVTNISVVKGLPDGLTQRAIAAARHILFFPAEKDGRTVSQYVVLEYNFNIY